MILIMSKMETNTDIYYNRARSLRIVRLIALAINISVTCALVAEESSTAIASFQESAGNSFPTPLSPDLPYDVDVAKVRKLDTEGKIAIAQREFDIMAWQAFIALNWPADKAG